MPTTPFDPAGLADRLAADLGAEAGRFAIEVIETCGSTNDVLAARAQRTDGRIGVLLALHQTAGRGRRGRSWLANPGDSLTFSCAWSTPPDAPPPSALSLTAGLAVAQACAALGVPEVGLKWPNDVLVGGQKLAGILVELASGQQRTRSAIIGIGINLDHPPELPSDARPATALFQHLPAAIAPERILATVLIELASHLDTFSRQGFGALRDRWKHFDAYAGQRVLITDEAGRQSGLYAGVAEDGALLLAGESGIKRILSGDVSLRPQP